MTKKISFKKYQQMTHIDCLKYLGINPDEITLNTYIYLTQDDEGDFYLNRSERSDRTAYAPDEQEGEYCVNRFGGLTDVCIDLAQAYNENRVGL